MGRVRDDEGAAAAVLAGPLLQVVQGLVAPPGGEEQLRREVQEWWQAHRSLLGARFLEVALDAIDSNARWLKGAAPEVCRWLKEEWPRGG